MEKDQIRGSVRFSGGRLTDISTDEQEFKLQFIDGKHSVVMHVAKIFCAKLTFPHNSMLFSITFKEKVTFSQKIVQLDTSAEPL